MSRFRPDPRSLAFTLKERTKEVSLSTIRQDIATIRWMHERHGAEDPTDHAVVERVLDDINQTVDKTTEKKQAVLTKHVRAMVETLPLDEPGEDAGPPARATHLRALRDRAIILVGYAGAFRRGELATIDAEDVTLNPDGMEIHVPRAKTVPRSAQIASDGEADAITGKTVRNVIGDAAEAAGLDRETVAGHSLRRRHLTQGALNGAELNRLMKQAGHTDPRTTAGYVEDVKRMETNTSRDLGLQDSQTM